jgi:hypothetical protein
LELIVATGYSGTPLAKKLGVKDGQRTWRYKMPASVADEIGREGLHPSLLDKPQRELEMIHVFVTQRRELAEVLSQARNFMVPSGIIWVSWPKKAARVATDMSEHAVRAEAFPLGLVDIKVCAVDEIWSGLKLVIRKAEREKA